MRALRRVLLAAACLGLSLSVAQAQQPRRPITHEDVHLAKRLGGPALSPDGRFAVFSVSEPAYRDEDASSDLWIVPTDGSAPRRRLTSTRGGMIGQSIALNYPRRLRSLALGDTMAVVPEEALPIGQERIDAVRDKGTASQLEPTMEGWFTPSFLKLNPYMLGIIRNEFLATPAQGYLGCIYAIRKLNYLDRLSKIEIPTLIMVGEDDPGTPVTASEAIHQRIPNSKLVIIKSARHLSNVEQPEVFNTNLLTFLKSL